MNMDDVNVAIDARRMIVYATRQCAQDGDVPMRII